MKNAESVTQRITDEVMSWPGVQSGIGERGEYGFRVGHREIGHLHGDYAAHFAFPKSVWLELKLEGRITEHPAFPGQTGMAARSIRDDGDVRDVIELMRLNYLRIVARLSPPVAYVA